MIDKEKFIKYVAEEIYEDWNEWNGSDKVYDMDEVHDLGLRFPISNRTFIEDLGEWEYHTIYEPFLNKNQDLVELINKEVERIKDDNYDPYWDDMATYRRMVFS